MFGIHWELDGNSQDPTAPSLKKKFNFFYKKIFKKFIIKKKN
jgi:hypothetical protein